jgi:hypothetical protein
MLEVRKRQRVALPRASGRCGFGEVTFAGTRGNDEDAPIAAFRVDEFKATSSRPSLSPGAAIVQAHSGGRSDLAQIGTV